MIKCVTNSNYIKIYQILFNGHWNEGAADFIGEEGEQAFAIYSRFPNSLKHTSSFSINNIKCYKKLN